MEGERMGRARKGCKFCDVRRNDWDWKKIPMGFGIFGDHVLNISVSGYRKRITVELEPDRTEPIWWEEVGIEYCPFCGTNLNALKREE